MNIVRGSSTRITKSFFDGETPVVLTDGVATVSIVSTDGAVLSQPAEVDSDTQVSTVVPAQSVLGTVTVTWLFVHSGGATYSAEERHSVVSSDVVTYADIRGADPVLANDTKYPTAKLAEARQRALDEFETILGYPLYEKAATADLSRTEGDVAVLPSPYITGILSATAQGTAFTADDLMRISRAEFGGLYVGDLPRDRFAATYTYGLRDVPADLRGALLTRIRYFLVAEQSGIPDRATSFSSTEGGTFTLATAGRGGSETGIPDVDAVLKRHKWTRIGMA